MNLVNLYGNQYFVNIMENISNLITIIGEQALSGPGRTQHVIEEHQTILEAIKRKDRKGAVAAMRHHIETTEKNVLKS